MDFLGKIAGRHLDIGLGQTVALGAGPAGLGVLDRGGVFGLRHNPRGRFGNGILRHDRFNRDIFPQRIALDQNRRPARNFPDYGIFTGCRDFFGRGVDTLRTGIPSMFST